MKIEELLKTRLNFKSVKATNYRRGGDISSGQTYLVDNDQKVFVKSNSGRNAKLMFEGELASLQAIENTKTIKVPKPYGVLHDGDEHYIVMEHLDLGYGSCQAKLGTNLANMHLNNLQKEDDDPDYVSKFGFDRPTCCGSIPQSNTWNDTWVGFYIAKLQEQIDLLTPNDADLDKYWPKLKEKIPTYFDKITVRPSLLHGDLWSGNAGSVGSEPVIYDAASFYGHFEYDLGIAGMFGGFNTSFYSAYHDLIPKEHGFEKRHLLYQLFHHLNHWNHFGSGYRSGTISIMKRLI